MDRRETLPMFDANGFTTDEAIAAALTRTLSRGLYASMYLLQGGKTQRVRTAAGATEIHLKEAIESLIPIVGRDNTIRILDSVKA